MTFMLAAFGAVAVTGCSDSASDCDIASVLDRLVVADDARIALRCDCFAELGYASRAECAVAVDLSPDLTPAQRDCLITQFGCDGAVLAFYRCALDRVEAFNECVSAAQVCGDDTSIDPCQAEAQATTCPAVPAAIDAALMACMIAP